MKSFSRGFTIIETMMFLAITGMMVAGIVFGTSSSISQQRYQDSVRSLQSYLKQVYSDVSNVSNERSNTLSCKTSNGSLFITDTGQSTGIEAGQSNCVILGKLITNGNNSNKLVVKNVMGDNTSSSNIKYGIGDFNGYAIGTYGQESYSMEWQTSVVAKNNNNDSSNFSILILKSPTNGTVSTFVDASESISDNKLGDLISSDNYKQAKLCVKSNGLSSGVELGVKIDINASGSSGVELLGDGGC